MKRIFAIIGGMLFFSFAAISQPMLGIKVGANFPNPTGDDVNSSGVGPVVYFNSNASPKKYFFVSLQNETLFDIDYLHWTGIEDNVRKCINFPSDFQKTDTTKKVSVFLYLISAPKFSFHYSVYTEEKKQKAHPSKLTISKVNCH